MSVELEFKEARPERFACFECGELTAIDVDNLTMPHRSGGVACSATGVRVMVRWPEEIFRCAVCGLGRLRATPGTTPQHDASGSPCAGVGQAAVQWKTLVPGNGIQYTGEKSKKKVERKPRTTAEPAATKKRAPRSTRRTPPELKSAVPAHRPFLRALNKAKSDQARQVAEKAARLALGRSEAKARAEAKTKARRQAWVNSPYAAEYRARQEDERAAASREQLQNRKQRGGKSRKTSPKPQRTFYRVVSGGLPGTARRH